MLQMNKSVLTVPRRFAQQVRSDLESNGLWDKRRKLQSIAGEKVAIPILDAALTKVFIEQKGIAKDYDIIQYDLPLSKTSLLQTPYDGLVKELKALVDLPEEDFNSLLLSSIPSHWEVHGDLLLLTSDAFQHDVWKSLGDKLWIAVGKSLRCRRVARKHRIEKDGFRSPKVEILLGENGKVQHNDNGIIYSYDVTKCMFSCGNVPEKLRVAQFNCVGETVVDLYAGIGYFTLPYLVKADAAFVHACDWNPDAVQALREALILNGVQHRCSIHYGNNQQVCPQGVADRVNLGLIPSSEEGWPVACKALKPSGGILHIHNNVTSFPVNCKTRTNGTNVTSIPSLEKWTPSGQVVNSDLNPSANCSVPDSLKSKKDYWQQWSLESAGKIETILLSLYNSRWKTRIMSINHVKSYAPHVDHIVLDLECRPAIAS